MGDSGMAQRLFEAEVAEQSALNLRLELEKQIVDSVQDETRLRADLAAATRGRSAAEAEAQRARQQRDLAKEEVVQLKSSNRTLVDGIKQTKVR